jgi:hypothetical protein
VRPSPAGEQARSSAAAAAVARWLDQAEGYLAAGRTAQASQRLDQAEKRLDGVPPADAAPLRARLERLRVRVSATPATAPPRATRAPAQDRASRAPRAKKAPAGEAPAVHKGADKAHGAPSGSRRPRFPRPVVAVAALSAAGATAGRGKRTTAGTGSALSRAKRRRADP